jgi:hypothetical protein
VHQHHQVLQEIRGSVVEGPAVPSIQWTNAEASPHSPLCHPERSRGICSAPLGPPKSSFQTPTPKQKCHPDRSVAKWRDLLFIVRIIEPQWKRYPPHCHPVRSRGICSSTDPSWKCFSEVERSAVRQGERVGPKLIPTIDSLSRKAKSE